MAGHPGDEPRMLKNVENVENVEKC